MSNNLPAWSASWPRPSLETHVTYPDALRYGYIKIGCIFYDAYGAAWQVTGIQNHAEGGVLFVTAKSLEQLGSGVFLPDMISYVEVPF